MMQIIFGLLKKITEFKKKILKLSHLFFLKKNEKKQTHYMTKKLFCQLNHGYLPLQYFGDGYYKIGKNDKKQSYLS
jgi:hypothetical protein